MDFSGTAVYTAPIRSRKPVFHMSSIPYFFDCTETIPAGVGFAPYGGVHLAWLAAAALCFAGGCLFYRRLCGRGRRRMRLVIAALTVGDELFKIWLLASHGNYTVDYLPCTCAASIFSSFCGTPCGPVPTRRNSSTPSACPARWRRCCFPPGARFRPPAACISTASPSTFCWPSIPCC